MEKTRRIIVIAVVISAGLPLAPGSELAAMEVGSGDSDDSISATVSVSRQNQSTAIYSVEIEWANNVSEVTLRLFSSRASFVSANGFDTSPFKAVSTGGSNGTLQIAYNISAAASTKCHCVVSSEFAILKPAYLPISYVVNGEKRSTTIFPRLDKGGIIERVSVVGSGVARVIEPVDESTSEYGTRGFVLLGDFTRIERRVPSGETIEIIAPTSGDSPAGNVSMRFEQLEFASKFLTVGPPIQRHRVFLIVPTTGSGGESPPFNDWLTYPGATSGWLVSVRAHSNAGRWFHEYIHTRQRFTPDRSSQWLTEGFATYFGKLLKYEYGVWSQAQFRASLNDPPQYRGGVLSEKDTWEGDLTPYTKGSVVAAYLDQRIREETNGNRTLVDVFRRLNQHQYVSHSVLKNVVAEVVGDDRLDDELDRFVTTDANPANHEYLYVVGEDPGITVTPPPTASPTVTPTLTKGAPPGSTESSTPTSQPSSGHPTSAGANDRDPAGGTTPGMGIAVTTLVLLGTVFLLRKGTLNWGD